MAVIRLRHEDGTCGCGSKQTPHKLYDAKGRFVAYVCKKCEKEMKRQYRPDIFKNGNYADNE